MKFQLITFFPAATAVLLFAGTVSAEIRGQVIDSRTGIPVVDAHVSVSDSTKADDSEKRLEITTLDGRFFFDSTEKGMEYTVRVTHISYDPAEVSGVIDGQSVRISLKTREIQLGEVVVRQGRSVADKTPGALTAIGSESVSKTNSIVEPPLLAMRVPNATFFNWGGHTLGATHIRIRGFDSYRLSVSVNGIPINDPEDHYVYWQDTPDFLSNTHDVQVERGVSSFLTAPSGVGGGMNLSTSDVVATRQVELGLFYGDFDTRRRTFLFRSGLIEEKYNFTGRFSRASSDGYRDHSSVDEWSYFLAATRFDENSVHTFNVYGGREVSDLSYTAIPQSIIDTNRTWTPEAHHELDYLGGWGGERDDFEQPHYILRSKWRLTPTVEIEGPLFWIEGAGYYEQYREGRDLEEYGLKYLDFNGDGVIDTAQSDETDLVRRKFVSKTQLGWLPKVSWQISAETELNAGLELRFYDSDHTNRVMWARDIPTGIKPQHAYNTWNMSKDYLGLSGSLNHRMNDRITVNGGLEVRKLSQQVNQDRIGLFRGLSFERDWTFVNPRAGINYEFNQQTRFYASMAMAGREPYVAQELNPDNPKDTVKVIDPEEMTDIEVGVRYRAGHFEAGANLYAMFFTNEITYTGRWDPTVEELQYANAPTSRHLGIEIDAVWVTPYEGLKISGDLGLDRSTFGEFQYHYIDEIQTDWSPVEKTVNAKGNPIPLTPNYVFNLRGGYEQGGLNLELSLHSVGRQYLDPLGDDRWSLASYSLVNATTGWRFKALGLGYKLSLSVLNLFGAEYNGYGWTETIWPGSDDAGNPQPPLSGRYTPMYIPAMGRMVTGGLTVEL